MPDVELLQNAVREAGAVALSFFGKPHKHWVKPDHSILTEADLAVNEFLHRKLMGARPDYGWLSEESPDDPSRVAKQMCWVLDPIDGTRSFHLGRNEWCIACALTDGDSVVLAAIYQPTLDKFYFAERGKGATCNGSTLVTSPSNTLQSARLAANASAFRKLEASGVAKMEMSFTPQILRLCMIAEGSADVLVAHGPKNDWDVAAGVLLAQEAGAKVTTESGVAMKFNQPHPRQPGMVAAHPQRHALMMKFMEQL
ncbi:MAG: 3'(2'),5'-bisphosphate nucleotidase CysQ [Aestuariivirga sp.]